MNGIVTKALMLPGLFFSIIVTAGEYEIDKWTNVSIYNSGGYASWYEASWYDSQLGITKNKKTGTLTAGYTHTFEFPPYARDVRVKAYSRTGLVWQPDKLIFDKMLGHGDILTPSPTGEGQYYKIKIWGTTLSPSWAPVSASLPSDGLDPYSNDASKCSQAKVSYVGNYAALMSPLPYEVAVVNKCRFAVRLTHSNDKPDSTDSISYVVNANESVTKYYASFPYRHLYHKSVGDRDYLLIYGEEDFNGYGRYGHGYGFNNDAATLPSTISGKLSSFSIPYGWKVRFYENENFKGRYWTRDSKSSDNKFAKDFNDIVKSIEILEKP